MNGINQLKMIVMKIIAQHHQSVYILFLNSFLFNAKFLVHVISIHLLIHFFQDVPVVDRIPHENYVPTSRAQENDIALLRLAHSVEFTDWIRPICLPIAPSTRNINYDENFVFVVAGWGKTEKSSSSNIKLKVELSGVPLEQCNGVYRAQNVVLSQKQLCAGGQPGKDSCRGMVINTDFICLPNTVLCVFFLF